MARDLLLAPLGMAHSSFDRATVHAMTSRAVGHQAGLAPPRVDSPMTGAGGLWTSAADLARFLRFELGDGTVDGRSLLGAGLVQQQRTVPATAASRTAGYALGISRTRWQAAGYADLFNHGGGGEGFLSDLWFAPQLGLGVAVLTNSDDNTLQGSLAMGIMNDLVVGPGSPYAARLVRLPAEPSVLPAGGDFVPPGDLGQRIGALALPASAQQSARWAAFPQYYRVGQLGAMDPARPASRFVVRSGVPYLDAGEDGSLVRHRLTEFRPGLFLADDGETLDLRAASRSWRGLPLNAVTNGPLVWQWAVLALAALLAAGWLVLGIGGRARRRTRAGDPGTSTAEPPGPRRGRRLAGGVASAAAAATLATVGAIALVPGLVDVGFLGRIDVALPARLAMHLPLALVLLTGAFAALVANGTRGHWWRDTRVRKRDLALLVGLAAMSVQLGAWHLVGWGF